jgi:hypothetical protein
MPDEEEFSSVVFSTLADLFTRAWVDKALSQAARVGNPDFIGEHRFWLALTAAREVMARER